MHGSGRKDEARMNLNNKIRELITENKFGDLEDLFYKTTPEVFQESLLDITFDNKNLVAYSLICMLLIKNETAQFHCFAAELLIHPLCIIEGAYASALYHVKKAIELDPGDICLKELLLFFHEVPDQLIGAEEARRIANEILKEKPDSKCAKWTLDCLSGE